MKILKCLLIPIASIPIFAIAQTYSGTVSVTTDEVHNPTIVGPVAVVTIQSGGSLTCSDLDFQGLPGQIIVASGGELIITGNVLNNANATLEIQPGGSMRPSSTTTFATANIRVIKDASSFGYSYVSPPISNATFAGDEYMYAESTVGGDNYGTWTSATGGNAINAGEGYATYQNGNILFIGTPNVGIVNLSLSLTSGGTRTLKSGHHLIGNPYTAAIDMNAFFALGSNTANTFGNYYIWNPANNSNAGGYDTYTGLGGEYISSGQAFFIQLDYSSLSDGNHSMTIDPSIMVADNNTDFFRKASSDLSEIVLNFSSQNDTNNKLTFRFDDNFTTSFDKRFDAYSIPFEEAGEIRVKSVYAEKAFDILAIPLAGDLTIPISLKTTDALTLNAEVIDFTSLPSGYTFELVNPTSQQALQISSGAFMSFDLPHLENETAFELRISAPATVLGQMDKIDFAVFTSGNQLNFKTTKSSIPSIIHLYSLGGQVIHSWSLPANDGEYTLPLSGNLNGLYLIKVQNGNGQYLKKVILN